MKIYKIKSTDLLWDGMQKASLAMTYLGCPLLLEKCNLIRASMGKLSDRLDGGFSFYLAWADFRWLSM